MEKATSKVVVFCTYKNKNTGGKIRKSREYNSMTELLAAMASYLDANPWTTVWYQTRVVYVFEGAR